MIRKAAVRILFLFYLFCPVALFGQVTITEIMYHPENQEDAEFLEIYNLSSSPVLLDNWCIEGVSFCFEPGQSIGAGEYLVLGADHEAFLAAYGFEPDGIFPGRLDNGGEWLRIRDQEGIVVDEVRYDDRPYWPVTPDGLGPSLEVIDPQEDNSIPRNWRASVHSLGHTAKARNSVDSDGLPPWFVEKPGFPTAPAPFDPIIVTVKVDNADKVWLFFNFFKTKFTQDFSVEMTDDGHFVDEVAGDGIFSTRIDGQPAGTLIRFHFVAQSGSGEMHLPRRDDTIRYTGTVVQSPPVETRLPLFEWFMDEDAYRRALQHRHTDETEPAVFRYNGILYDGIQVRLRGGSARWWPKPHWKFIFPQGHPFEAPELFSEPIERMNLQSSYGDKTYLREILSYETFADAGVPSFQSFPVWVQRNGMLQGLYIYLEQADEEWFIRNRLSLQGALYKAYGQANLPESEEELHEDYDKKSREDEPYTDLVELLTGINALTGKDLKNFLYDNLDLPEMFNYLAVQALIHNNDHVAKNYYLFRDTEGTRRWKMLPWDMDLTFGRNYLGEPTAEWGKVLNDTLWADVDRIPERPLVSPSHPLFGDRNHQKWDYLWNRIIDAVYRFPELKQMYFRRLRTLMDQFLAGDRFERRLDEMVPLIRQEAQLDAAKWGQYGEPQTLEEAVEYLKRDYLEPRRIHLFETHRIAGEIPEAQSGDVEIVINEIRPVAEAGSGLEFIELFNPSWSESVDLSGWTIEGIKLDIPPGTVLLPRAFVVFAENDRALRRAGHADILIAAEYDGKLRDEGEELVLRDAADRVVDSVHYLDSEEWPSPGEGGSLELVDPASDNRDPSNWKISTQVSGTPGRANSQAATILFRSHFPLWKAEIGDYIGLAVSNYLAKDNPIRFTAYNQDGTLSDFPVNPSVCDLDAFSQLALLGAELFDGRPSTDEPVHILLESSVNPTGSFFMYGNSRQLDGAVSLSAASERIFFTRAAGRFRGWAADVTLGIVNPNPSDIGLQLELVDEAGKIVESTKRTIRSMGSLADRIEDLFDSAGTGKGGYIRATSLSGGGILGTEVIDLDEGRSLVVLNAVPLNPEMEVFSAQLATGPGIFTEINLVNTSAQERRITALVLSANGETAAGPLERTLAPGEQWSGDALELFQTPEDQLTVGSLWISADGNGVVGDVVFGEPTLLEYAAALPLQSKKARQMIFSHVAVSDQFFTGLAFFNPGMESASIRIRVYSAGGTPAGETEINLEAGNRRSRFLRELISTDDDLLGGYVVVKSTVPVVAQELFGSLKSVFLSAVPPHIVQ